MTDNQWTVLIAAYAAIVATGALFLEIRRWFETGPRIQISVMPVAKLYGRFEEDASTYLALIVTNFGSAPTTVTNMLVHRFDSVFAKLRNKPSFSALVKEPNTDGRPIPHILQVGSQWHGRAIYNAQLVELARSGKLYVGICCSHRKNVFWQQVKLPKPDRL